MTNTIDDSFIKHFQAEVVTAYQQMGSKLRSTVRSKTDVVGETTTFQVIGKGSAATKNRNGSVPTMEVLHIELDVSPGPAAGWAVDHVPAVPFGAAERAVPVSHDKL